MFTLKFCWFEIRDLIAGGFCCVLVHRFSIIADRLFNTDRFFLFAITRNTGIKSPVY